MFASINAYRMYEETPNWMKKKEIIHITPTLHERDFIISAQVNEWTRIIIEFMVCIEKIIYKVDTHTYVYNMHKKIYMCDMCAMAKNKYHFIRNRLHIK